MRASDHDANTRYDAAHITTLEFHMSQKKASLRACMYKFRMAAMMEEIKMVQEQSSNIALVLDAIWSPPGCYDPYYYHMSLVEAALTLRHLEEHHVVQDEAIQRIIEPFEEQTWIRMLCNKLSYEEFGLFASRPPLAARIFLYLSSEHAIVTRLYSTDYGVILKGLRAVDPSIIRMSMDRFVSEGARLSSNTAGGFSCHDFDLAWSNVNETLDAKTNGYVEQLRALMPALDCESLTYDALFKMDKLSLMTNRRRVLYLLHCRERASGIYSAMTPSNISYMIFSFDQVLDDYPHYRWGDFGNELIEYLRSEGILPSSVNSSGESPSPVASTCSQQSNGERSAAKTLPTLWNHSIPTRLVFKSP